ncbi:glycosyltransferase, partial [Kaistella daneshvariae]
MTVSICCITYNHEDYIRKSLESFMMQKCAFSFEVLIHDDASADGTQEIIKEFQEKYPDIIKPIFQTENQYSKKIGSVNAKFNFPRAKGKYIALCEGDDYWTDPLKLQKQVDFLENNPDCSMVFTNAHVSIEDDGKKMNEARGLFQFSESKFFKDFEILENWVVPTASVLFRKKYLDENLKRINNLGNFLYGDIVLFLYLSTKGKLYGMNDPMVVYRRHIGGVTNIK